MKNGFRFSLAAAAIGLITGCVNVDYVGQSFAPLPETEPVAYFSSRGDIPAGKYRIIGRGRLETTRRIDGYDLREILVDEARKHGADAVALVSRKRVKVGLYPQESNMLAGPSSYSANPYNLNPDGSQIEMDSFGAPAELQGEATFRSELHVRVLFLKDRETLETLLSERGRELDALVKQPDPADAKPEED